MRRLLALAACSALICLPQVAHAQLLGASVTGSINFNGGSTNFFDPANGYVPAGFSNTAGSTVTIAEPTVEFGYDDTANRDTANFTDNQLIINDDVFSSGFGAGQWIMTFTSDAFAGINLNKVSDSFDNGGANASLTGNTIIVTWAGVEPPATTGLRTATFNLTPTGVPEPGTLALLGLALPVVGMVRGRKAL